MLSLIGLGLHDEKDLSLRALEELKKTDEVFIELYTSKWHGSIESLEKLIGKRVKVLKRRELEEGASKLLDLASQKSIAILVQGDPLIATTHAVLVQEARKRGIEVKIIHNASIVSAIGESGLHIYKFGPLVTIPFRERTKGKLPESVYETIKMNKARGLHTLCLLDVLNGKFMSIKEGLQRLLEVESARGEGVITLDSKIIALVKLGSPEAKVVYEKVEALLERDIKELPAALIIPGILHFTEKEYLSLICGKE